jgi:hypothetical protein
LKVRIVPPYHAVQLILKVCDRIAKAPIIETFWSGSGVFPERETSHFPDPSGLIERRGGKRAQQRQGQELAHARHAGMAGQPRLPKAVAVMSAMADDRDAQRAARRAETEAMVEAEAAKAKERSLFDVILSSPPSFAGEPRDLADRAWHAGPDYRDIAMLFIQARERLASGGCMYVLFSSDSDLDLLGSLISRAGFTARLVAKRSILIESLIIYELTLRR